MPDICITCNGKGKLLDFPNGPHGMDSKVIRCYGCNGTGKVQSNMRCSHDGAVCHHRCPDNHTGCFRAKGGMTLSVPEPQPKYPLTKVDIIEHRRRLKG